MASRDENSLLTQMKALIEEQASKMNKNTNPRTDSIKETLKEICNEITNNKKEIEKVNLRVDEVSSELESMKQKIDNLEKYMVPIIVSK